MWALFGSLSVVPWILFAQSSWNMDAVPIFTGSPPSTGVTTEVLDRADVFGPGAEQRAREALRRIHREHRVPVLIETIGSLEGAWIADVARRQDRMAGADQLFVLVAGSERDVGVIAARRGPASRLTDQQRESIRLAFLGPLRAGEPDVAIEQGVGAIGATLNSVATSRPIFHGRDVLISLPILVVTLVIVFASRTWVRSRGRNRRPQPKADQTIEARLTFMH